MIIKRLRIFAFVILCIFGVVSSKAQVTIGSGLPPMKGALLDLKEYETTSPSSINGSNSNKGLLLPRVSLNYLDRLDDIISNPTNDDNNLHAGLVVYNIKVGADYGPGVYLWDGKRWYAISKSSNIGNPAALDDESNSFIVKPQSQYYIPITKAYTVWAMGSTETGSTASLDDVATANISAELLWQDEVGVVSSIQSQIVDVGGVKMIKVALGNVEGNALVAVRISGSDDTAQTVKNIRWSWHLWVTNYDPQSGTTYNATTSKKTYTYMDRELGATSTLPDNFGVIGVVYQWGRKDPFVTFENFSGSSYKKLYDINGTQINTASQLPNGIKIEDAPDNANNIAESLMNPTAFFIQGTGSSWNTNNWDDNDKAVIKQLWATSNIDSNIKPKSKYDPCPKGWRVPYDAENVSPFESIPSLPNTPSSNHGTGYDFGSAFGYVDGMGGRSELGLLGFKGAAFWWGGAHNGMSNITSACINFLNISGISLGEQPGRTGGYVRCVKDE